MNMQESNITTTTDVTVVTTPTEQSTPKVKRAVSAETRARMSASHRNSWQNGSHRAAFERRTNFSQEMIDAIRVEYANRKDADGKIVCTYKSLAEKYHVSIGYVYLVLRNRKSET